MLTPIQPYKNHSNIFFNVVDPPLQLFAIVLTPLQIATTNSHPSPTYLNGIALIQFFIFYIKI